MYVDCENLTLQQKPEVGGQQTAKQEIADDSFDCSNLTAAQLEQVALLTAAANPGQSSVSLMVMTPVESLLDIVQVLSGTAAQIVSMSSIILKGNSSKGTTSEVPIWVDAGVGVPPSVGKIDMEMYQSPADKPSVVVQTQSKSTHNPSFRILEHVIIPSQQPGSIGKQEQQLMATTAGGSAQTSVQSPTLLSLLTANNVNHQARKSDEEEVQRSLDFILTKDQLMEETSQSELSEMPNLGDDVARTIMPSVLEISNSSADHKALCHKLSRKTMNKVERALLCDLIIDYFTNLQLKLERKVCLALCKEVTLLFPKETEEK
ncbi:GL12322 [Drosophila persimilis]|uniref:GL12322 n=1 Tax=Drosophila persimilis TaxID=7234 RepID=B4GM44_DROPE|nr:GL12322 [Drosophila persimilis]